MIDKFSLPRLTEGKTVDGEGAENVIQSALVETERIEGDDPFDSGAMSCLDVPVGDEFTFSSRDSFFPVRKLKEVVPRIIVGCESLLRESSAIFRSHLLAYHEALVAIDATFTLFQVNGVSGQVPMHDAATVGVKVETLLADRGGGENERAKG